MTIAAKPQQELINKPKQDVINPPKPLPLPQLLNRVILFGAGAGLLAWGLSLTASRVTLVTATKAFVNGKIVTVNSPMNGQIQSQKNLDSGIPIKTKQLLLKVKEPLANSQWVQNLKLELVTDKTKLESLEAKIHEVALSGKSSQSKRNQPFANESSLEGETSTVREVAFNRLEAETAQTKSDSAVRIAEQNIKTAEIELKMAYDHARVAKAKYEKYQFLAKQGAMSNFSVEEVLNTWRVSQKQIEQAKVKLETTRLELVKEQQLRDQQAKFQKLKNNLPSLPANQLAFNSKLATLNPELADLMRQKTELQLSIQAKEKAIEQAEQSSAEQKNYPILASSKGVLWEVLVQDGEQVNSGQPLLKELNCQQLWVDAFVNIDALQRISIGSDANVEIYGSNIKLNGRVKTIRSPLSNKEKLGQDIAINAPDLQNQQLAQVRIELDNPQVLVGSQQNSGQFCQVGQVAKVNIQPKDSLLANLPSW